MDLQQRKKSYQRNAFVLENFFQMEIFIKSFGNSTFSNGKTVRSMESLKTILCLGDVSAPNYVNKFPDYLFENKCFFLLVSVSCLKQLFLFWSLLHDWISGANKIIMNYHERVTLASPIGFVYISSCSRASICTSSWKEKHLRRLLTSQYVVMCLQAHKRFTRQGDSLSKIPSCKTSLPQCW